MRKSKKFLLLILACCLGMALFACNAGKTKLVDSISVSYSNGNTIAGGGGTLTNPYTIELTGSTQSVKLNYLVAPDDAADKKVLWQPVKISGETVTVVSTSAVLSITKTDSDVTITRKANGVQYVAATSNDKNKQLIFKVTVDIPPVAVSSIGFSSNDNVYMTTAEEKANEESELYNCDYNLALAQGTVWNMSKGELDKTAMSHRTVGETPDLDVLRYYPAIESFTLNTSANPADSTLEVKYYSEAACTTEITDLTSLPAKINIDNSSNMAAAKPTAIALGSSFGTVYAKVYAKESVSTSILIRIEVEKTYGGAVLESDFNDKTPSISSESDADYSGQTYWATEFEPGTKGGATRVFIEDWRYYYLQAGNTVSSGGTPEFYIWTMTDAQGAATMAQGGVKMNSRAFGENALVKPTDAIWNKIHIPSNSSSLYAYVGAESGGSDFRIRAIDPTSGTEYILRNWAPLSKINGDRIKLNVDLTEGEGAKIVGKNVIMLIERKFNENAGNAFISFNFSGLNIVTTDVGAAEISIGLMKYKQGDTGVVPFTFAATPLNSKPVTIVYAEYQAAGSWIPVTMTPAFAPRNDLMDIDMRTGAITIKETADVTYQYRMTVAILVSDQMNFAQKTFKVKEAGAVETSALEINGLTEVTAAEKADIASPYYNCDYRLTTRVGTHYNTTEGGAKEYGHTWMLAYDCIYGFGIDLTGTFDDTTLIAEYFSNNLLSQALANPILPLTIDNASATAMSKNVTLGASSAGTQWVKIYIDCKPDEYLVVKISVESAVVSGILQSEIDAKIERDGVREETFAAGVMPVEDSENWALTDIANNDRLEQDVLQYWNVCFTQTNTDNRETGIGAGYLAANGHNTMLKTINRRNAYTDITLPSTLYWNVVKIPANATKLNVLAGANMHGSAIDLSRVSAYILTGDNKGQSVVLKDWNNIGYLNDAWPGTNAISLSEGDAAKIKGQDIVLIFEQKFTESAVVDAEDFTVFSGMTIEIPAVKK